MKKHSIAHKTKRAGAGLAAALLVCAAAPGDRVALAYDGDVDYSAPYLTVDPETGKLITVDPKAQQTQHPAAAPSGTQPAAPSPGGAGGQEGTVLARSGAPDPVSAGQETQSSRIPVIASVIGAGLILLGIIVAVRSNRKKYSPAAPGGESRESS